MTRPRLCFALVSLCACTARPPAQPPASPASEALAPAGPSAEAEPVSEAPEPVDAPSASEEAVTFDTIEHPPVADGTPFWNIREVMANAIYVPDPSQSALQRTTTAQSSKASGHNMTRFCVTPSGKPSRVETIVAFPDDPEIDRICLETVSKWRFKPFMVDGKATEICSDALFSFKFH